MPFKDYVELSTDNRYFYEHNVWTIHEIRLNPNNIYRHH